MNDEKQQKNYINTLITQFRKIDNGYFFVIPKY